VNIDQVGAICDVVGDAAVSHELLNPAVSTQADALAVIRYREDNWTLAKQREYVLYLAAVGI
jgi:hypothetical protein